MAPKKKRGQKADTEESGPAQESNKKQRKAGGKKTKVKKPEDLENEYSKFVGEEKGRVMKEFEEQKETITEDTEDYEQMIREVMWDDIRETEEDLDSRLESIVDKYSCSLDLSNGDMTQEEMLEELEKKKTEVSEAMEEASDDACSRLREAEQNAGEDNAAADPDNQNVTHLSLGFGYGRGGRGVFGGW